MTFYLPGPGWGFFFAFFQKNFAANATETDLLRIFVSENGTQPGSPPKHPFILTIMATSIRIRNTVANLAQAKVCGLGYFVDGKYIELTLPANVAAYLNSGQITRATLLKKHGF